MEYELRQEIDKITLLLEQLIEETHETNKILREGVKSQFGHGLRTLEMDPKRFKNNERTPGSHI